MKINLDEITVKAKIIENQKLKAIIGLDFGEFVVKGFRIMESEFENLRGEKMWLTPPSYRGVGRYHPIFYIPDKELWQKLEMKIWEEYDKQVKEHYKKRLEITDDDIGI